MRLRAGTLAFLIAVAGALSSVGLYINGSENWALQAIITAYALGIVVLYSRQSQEVSEA